TPDSRASVTTTSTPAAKGSISSTVPIDTERLAAPVVVEAERRKSLGPQTLVKPGQDVQRESSYNSNNGRHIETATITDVSSASETLYEKLDSNTIKNMIVAAAVLGIIFFLFFYNKVITYYFLKYKNIILEATFLFFFKCIVIS
ncbi:CYIR protein, partial [Plasmodium cynomolgi strain B]